jgi:hypothetical protein
MEMEALFLSCLPIDISYQIYGLLCKQKIIPQSLKDEIKAHVLLNDIKTTFIQCFIHDYINGYEYFYIWLENVILRVESLIDVPISTCTNIDEYPRRISYLWNLLTVNEQIKLYYSLV